MSETLRVAWRPGKVRPWAVLTIKDGNPVTLGRFLTRSEAITAIATHKEKTR